MLLLDSVAWIVEAVFELRSAFWHFDLQRNLTAYFWTILWGVLAAGCLVFRHQGLRLVGMSQGWLCLRLNSWLVVSQRVRCWDLSGFWFLALFVTDTSCIHYSILLIFSVLNLLGKLFIRRKRLWLWRWQRLVVLRCWWCLWWSRASWLLLFSWGSRSRLLRLSLISGISAIWLILLFWSFFGLLYNDNLLFLFRCFFLLRSFWLLFAIGDLAPNPDEEIVDDELLWSRVSFDIDLRLSVWIWSFLR